MPKTKEQKQIEAIERNQKMFFAYQQTYLENSEGGKLYVRRVATNRAKFAKEEAERQKIIFEDWCKANNLDTDGNII